MIVCVLLLLLLLLLLLPLPAPPLLHAAAAMPFLMWESDWNLKFEMWSLFVFGLVCFPLCSSVHMNEHLCLAFGLSSGFVVFLDCLSLVALCYVVLQHDGVCIACGSCVARALYWPVLCFLHFFSQAIDGSGGMF